MPAPKAHLTGPATICTVILALTACGGGDSDSDSNADNAGEDQSPEAWFQENCALETEPHDADDTVRFTQVPLLPAVEVGSDHGGDAFRLFEYDDTEQSLETVDTLGEDEPFCLTPQAEGTELVLEAPLDAENPTIYEDDGEYSGSSNIEIVEVTTPDYPDGIYTNALNPLRTQFDELEFHYDAEEERPDVNVGSGEINIPESDKDDDWEAQEEELLREQEEEELQEYPSLAEDVIDEAEFNDLVIAESGAGE